MADADSRNSVAGNPAVQRYLMECGDGLKMQKDLVGRPVMASDGMRDFSSPAANNAAVKAHCSDCGDNSVSNPVIARYLGGEETAQDSGTSEGAKKGWEHRQRGGGAISQTARGYDLVDHLDENYPGWQDHILSQDISHEVTPGYRHPGNPDLDLDPEQEDRPIGHFFDKDSVNEAIGEGYLEGAIRNYTHPKDFAGLRDCLVTYFQDLHDGL